MFTKYLHQNTIKIIIIILTKTNKQPKYISIYITNIYCTIMNEYKTENLNKIL